MLEGLAFFGHHAIMGISRARNPELWAGLPLAHHLVEKGAVARCGVQVIDLRSGEVLAWIRLEGEFYEVRGVAVLAGIKKPQVLTVG